MTLCHILLERRGWVNKITNEYPSLQKYKSLTLYFRKGDVRSCVRDEWRQGQTAMLTQVLLATIAALLSHLGWGCSTMGHWRPSHLQAGSHFDIPVSTQLDPPWHLLTLFPNIHLLLLFFRLFTQVLFLVDGSIEGPYITLVRWNKLSGCQPLKTRKISLLTINCYLLERIGETKIYLIYL